jgi:hypothetical protein
MAGDMQKACQSKFDALAVWPFAFRKNLRSRAHRLLQIQHPKDASMFDGRQIIIPVRIVA